ncbi:MAG: 6-phosphogluconolactonase, partial [Spirochaetaceae bacterium]|nr:6-phosphogluconolactonase [Spirochaetaceae bacterium]
IIREKPDALICIATGGSTREMYRGISNAIQVEPEIKEKIRLIALDEWYGLPSNHPATCTSYIRQNVSNPWGIPEKQVLLFNAAAADPVTECKRIEDWLKLNGPLDLCILGLGRNGHLGLNEPGVDRSTKTHVAELETSSQSHAMLSTTNTSASRGMTLGILEILQSKKILFLVTGPEKKEPYQAFIEKKDPNRWPANFLWEHNDVTCILDTSSV